LEGIAYDAYVITYFTQTQGKELIYYKNKVGENLTAQNQLVLEGVAVNYAVEQGSQDSLVLWFYRVGEAEALSSMGVKASQLRYMFKSVPAEAFILKVKCELTCERALESEETLEILKQLRNVRMVE
jgi:hypothetical protein